MWSVSSQRGSAVTDFVLVAFPMLAIFIATLSITLGSYAKMVLLEATIEGARYASLADQDLSSGQSKVRQLVLASLGKSFAIDVEGFISRSGSVETINLKSKLQLATFPGFQILEATSVATREIEY